MNKEIEKLVWAAAFANEFQRERNLFISTTGHNRTVDDISGFSCAEVADVVLEKYREAIDGPDANYLSDVALGK